MHSRSKKFNIRIYLKWTTDNISLQQQQIQNTLNHSIERESELKASMYTFLVSCKSFFRTGVPFMKYIPCKYCIWHTFYIYVHVKCKKTYVDVQIGCTSHNLILQVSNWIFKHPSIVLLWFAFRTKQNKSV